MSSAMILDERGKKDINDHSNLFSTFKEPTEIDHLYYRFLQVSNQVEVHHDISSLNLIDFDKESEPDDLFDVALKKAKLKRIENRVELDRANMELQKRQKRRLPFKRKTTTNSQQKAPALSKQDSYNFDSIYSQFKQHSNLKVTFERHRRQSINTNFSFPNQEKEQKPPKDIAYYDQLKKHPILLKYTMQKMKQKKREKDIDQDRKKEELKKYVDQMDSFCMVSRRVESQFLRLKAEQNEDLVEHLKHKIYCRTPRKVKHNLDSSPQIGDFRRKQNKISSSSKSSLSSENTIKLEERLSSIAQELCQSRRFSADETRGRARTHFSTRLSKRSHSTISSFP